MTNFLRLASTAVATLTIGLFAVGCSHSPTSSLTDTSTPITSSAAQPFNPTVAPPGVGNTPCYSFEQTPAPVPPPTPAVQHQLHRYLHVVYKTGHCYLADNYGHYYNCGRTSSGDLYPVYQDTVTDAVCPLYYDQERDSYYRCVDNASGTGDDEPAGYYRNYIGDSEYVYYEGDDDQPEECQSPDCQPFIINYYSSDSGYSYYRYHRRHGFNATYAYYSGPVYRPNNIIDVVPSIVAAYILFQPHEGVDSGDYSNNNTIVVNKHYYYQRNVLINNYNNRTTNVHYAAMPGPPLGHFGGYRPSGNGSNLSAMHVHALPPVILPGRSGGQFAGTGVRPGSPLLRTAVIVQRVRSRSSGAQGRYAAYMSGHGRLQGGKRPPRMARAAVGIGAAAIVAHHYAVQRNHAMRSGSKTHTYRRTVTVSRQAGHYSERRKSYTVRNSAQTMVRHNEARTRTGRTRTIVTRKAVSVHRTKYTSRPRGGGGLLRPYRTAPAHRQSFPLQPRRQEMSRPYSAPHTAPRQSFGGGGHYGGGGHRSEGGHGGGKHH